MIFRVRHQARYVAVQNATVRDPNLSLKATGLLVFLLSFPDDATFTREQVARMKRDGVSAIRTALRELADAGYLTYARTQDANGRWRTEVVIQERPIPPKADFQPSVTGENRRPPKARFPTVGKRACKDFEVPTTKDLAKPPRLAPDGAAASLYDEPPHLVGIISDGAAKAAELRQMLLEGRLKVDEEVAT